MRLRLVALTSMALAAWPGAALPADPAKVLRVAFLSPRPDSTRRRAATSTRTTSIARSSIRPTPYDYLARPYRIVPNTAAALPEISADGLTWTIRIEPGIHFADDPAFKGTAARADRGRLRLLAGSACSIPTMRSPNLQQFDGKFVGADALVAKAKETGTFDYDAPIEGLQAIDRYTMRIKLTAPSYDLLAEPDDRRRRRGRARGDRGLRRRQRLGDGQSRRHRAVPAEGMAARAEDRARGESRRIATCAFPTSTDPADREIVARMRGKKLPLIGRVEISIIEESNPRLLAFEKGDLDYVAVPPELIANVLEPGNALKPRFAKAGVQARARHPADDRLHVLQHGGSGRRRLHARTRSRCGARSAWPTTSTTRSACSARGRRCRRRSRCRRASPATIRSSTATSTTTRPARARCSTSSATSTATATAGATCPTAGRSCCTSRRPSAPSSGSSTSCGSAASRRSASGSNS